MKKQALPQRKPKKVLVIFLLGLMILPIFSVYGREKKLEHTTRQNVDTSNDAFEQPENYFFCHRCGMAVAKTKKVIMVYGVQGEPWHQCCPMCALKDIVETGDGNGRIEAFSNQSGGLVEVVAHDNKITSVRPEGAVLLVGGSCIKNKTFLSREEAILFIANNDWANKDMIKSIPKVLKMILKKAGPIERCSMCTATLAGHAHTWFTIITKEKKRMVGCCAHCGIFMLHKLRGRYMRVVTRDWPSGEDIDAKKAIYVVGSSKVTCCVPSTISFAKRSEAEAFLEKYGGTLYNLEQALKNIEKIMSMH